MNARAAATETSRRLADAGVEMAAFEGELLVRQAAQISREQYFAGARLREPELARLAGLLTRRLRREPHAYIAGEREFYGLTFAVTPDVLIPRPETELLVDLAVIESRGRSSSVVLDIGTGSGCAAVAVATFCSARVIATDVSPAALTVARANARRHGARVLFARSDLAAAVRAADVVVANLPYIPTREVEALEPEVRDWEPRIALDGGDDGMALIRRLVQDCALRLRPGLLALEVGYGQAAAVGALVCDSGAEVSVVPDLAGIDRVVCGRWRAA